jgi:hypothetical protein
MEALTLPPSVAEVFLTMNRIHRKPLQQWKHKQKKYYYYYWNQTKTN